MRRLALPLRPVLAALLALVLLLPAVPGDCCAGGAPTHAAAAPHAMPAPATACHDGSGKAAGAHCQVHCLACLALLPVLPQATTAAAPEAREPPPAQAHARFDRPEPRAPPPRTALS